ncbi:hypothetical protein OG21DRAFT_1522464 [Imleria badia]|nr:hypothetical protein OG21DRAFT_1522464 [Imleria badia]
MKTILVSTALFAAGVLAQSFTLNTPSSVVECEPVQITWSGGSSPFYLSGLRNSIHPGSTPNGAALESFPSVTSSPYIWTVNIASGTSIGFTLIDGSGATAQTAAVTVSAGSSTSCSNSTSAATGATGSSTSGGATTPATTPATTAAGTTTTSPVATIGGTTSTSTTAAPSTSATGTTSKSSGAAAKVAQFGVAGVVGAAVAALFL